MPTTILAPPSAYAARPATQLSVRRCVWLTALTGSRLPEVLCHEFGWNLGFTLPIVQTILLITWAIFLARSHERGDLAGFALTIAALLFAWSVAAPWLDQCASIQSISQSLSWSGRFYLSRIIRLIGVVLISITFIGSGIGSRELFLRLGNWKVRVQEARLVFRQLSWLGLAATLGMVFSLVLAVYLAATTQTNLARICTLPLLLLSCVPIALLNAANEEFQFRSALLARLTKVVSPREAAVLCAVIFGIGHFFGHPSGWGGVLITGFGAWVCALSMIETRGFTWAWMTHFAQDMLIFVFIALSATN